MDPTPDKTNNPETSASNPNSVPERGRSPVQSWIRFEEDEKRQDSVATIVPTQTIQVDSVLNTSLTEELTLPDSDNNSMERSSSPPQLVLTPGRVSPKSALPPPPAPSRPIRKTASEVPSNRSSCPPDFGGDNGHSVMQNIPLSENAVHQRHANHHGITQGFSE